MDLHAIEALREALAKELEPAGPRGVQAAFKRLSSSYGSKKLDEEGEEERALAWLETMKGWPMFALRGAVHAWLKKNTEFMPSPGQFYNLGRPLIDAKQKDLLHCSAILDAAHQPDAVPIEEAPVDPDMAKQLRRLAQAMANKEDIAELRRKGVLW